MSKASLSSNFETHFNPSSLGVEEERSGVGIVYLHLPGLRSLVLGREVLVVAWGPAVRSTQPYYISCC